MEKYYLAAKINDKCKDLPLEKDNKHDKYGNYILNSNSKNNPDPSPKTLKRNKSRENFMKFQWGWVI